MNILLIGRNGQVAHELRRSLACLGDVRIVDRQSDPAVDLSEIEGLGERVMALRPDLIVNAAAYTAVDKAESEPDLAQRVNGDAPRLLAEVAARLGAGFIHYSTDYVFPGDAERPYSEDAATGPLGVYGRGKLAGELGVQASGADFLIFRTAWVYGRRGGNFLLTMLRLMAERERLGIVDDQFGAPTWSRMIAEVTALAIAKSIQGGRFRPPAGSGIYHLTAAGSTAWFGFAERIRDQAQARGLLPEAAARLDPIPTSAYPTPARRPAYSVLDNDKLRRDFGLALPDWETGLDLCLSD